MVQYRGNHNWTSAKKVRDIINAQIIFTTRKMKTCMHSLKSSFSRELKSQVVYRHYLNDVGANPSMLARRSDIRHLTTRIEEHRKEDSPVGQHIRKCGSKSAKSEFKWMIIDQA